MAEVEDLEPTNPKTGLSDKEAQKRLRNYGLNQISIKKELSFWDIAKEEITEPMILLLLVVAFFYSIWGKLSDALTILTVISVLVLVEIYNEFRAKKAIASLSKLAAPITKVLRDGVIKGVRVEEVVPGDIIILTQGTRIPADARLMEAYSLFLDESALTGESFPQEKSALAAQEKKGLFEKTNVVFTSTLVLSGEGRSQVYVTGKETEIGKIAKLAEEIKEPKTPLQLAMKSLSASLVWFALFFSIAIPLLGFLRGQNLRQMILTGLSLSFATIPEELPIIITMVLGLGAYKLSKKRALVKKLKAAETLGSTTVIATDKTGTLTLNKLKIKNVWPALKDKEVLKATYLALPNNFLDPIDQAVLEKARSLDFKDNLPALKEKGFNETRKIRSIIRKENKEFILSASGAPEEIFKIVSDQVPKEALEFLEKETAQGKKVIACAKKVILKQDLDKDFSLQEKDLDFIGLISFEDPLRPDIKKAIDFCRQAKIRVIMITGDHPNTARFVAKETGIDSDAKVVLGKELDALSNAALKEIVKEKSVFARTTPEHKLRIVKALHQNGEVVAVTGDGINDVLALKESDIGVAMGIKGTDASKEAADIILTDDNLGAITNAIFEGRKIFDNLTKGVRYYLSVKIALILIFLIPIIFNLPLPFQPIQIIVLELFMDLAASATFVAEPAETGIFKRPPRDPKEKFMNSKMIETIVVAALSLFAAVIASYFLAFYLKLPLLEAQTMAFSAWIFGHIFLAFNLRSQEEPIVHSGFLSNKIMIVWSTAAISTLLLAMVIPALQNSLKVTLLDLSKLGLAVLISFMAIFWMELKKIFSFYFKQRQIV